MALTLGGLAISAGASTLFFLLGLRNICIISKFSALMDACLDVAKMSLRSAHIFFMSRVGVLLWAGKLFSRRGLKLLSMLLHAKFPWGASVPACWETSAVGRTLWLPYQEIGLDLCLTVKSNSGKLSSHLLLCSGSLATPCLFWILSLEGQHRYNAYLFGQDFLIPHFWGHCHMWVKSVGFAVRQMCVSDFDQAT